MSFHDRLHKAFNREQARRAQAGESRLTKTDVWKAAGASSGAATHWFSGTNGMDLRTCIKVAPLLRSNPWWLFDESMGMDEPWSASLSGKTLRSEREGDHAPTPPPTPQISPSSNTNGVPISSHSSGRGAIDLFPEGARDDVVVVQVFDAQGLFERGEWRPAEDVVADKMMLYRSWIDRALPSVSSTAALAIIPAPGEHMEDTFFEGDLLLVDRGITEILNDAIYVLSIGGQRIIRRVQHRQTDGALMIKCDNQVFDSMTLEDDWRDRLEVLGRVVWAWSGRKM